MEPHHRRCYMPVAPLRWRPVSSPVHARWCPRGSRKGASSGRTAPVRRLTGQDDGPYTWERRGPIGGRSRQGSRRPRAPGPRWGARAATGLRPLPGPFLPEHCPSFTIRVHNEDTRSPVYFGHFNSLWTLLVYYFCLIKASPRPDATPTVSVVGSFRHNILAKKTRGL